MPEDPITVHRVKGLVDGGYDRSIHILDLPATNAPNVVVVFDGAVETSLSPRQLELLDHSCFRQNFKIPIDGSQADPGKAFPDNFIHIVGGRVALDFGELFKNDPPLFGCSQGWSLRLRGLNANENYYY